MDRQKITAPAVIYHWRWSLRWTARKTHNCHLLAKFEQCCYGRS